MSLAVMLGKPLYELDLMPPEEINDWLLYMTLEPHGERRLDLNFARLAQLNLSAWTKPVPSIEDCMLQFKQNEQYMTDEEKEAHKENLVQKITMYAQMRGMVPKEDIDVRDSGITR